MWLIIAVICSPALYTYILRPAAYKLRRRDSSSWAATTTKTLSATVRDIGRHAGPWEVTLVYSYKAEDEYQYGEEKKLFSDEADASDFISSIENSQLPVRFDPKKPSLSELVY